MPTDNTTPSAEERVQLNVKVPAVLVERLRAFAAKTRPRAPVSEHVILAFEEYLAKHDR